MYLFKEISKKVEKEKDLPNNRRMGGKDELKARLVIQKERKNGKKECIERHVVS